MSLRDLNLPARSMLRRHGWLLTLWCVGLGWATSWALLHVAHLEHPVPRYAITAAVMYWIGLLWGVRFWLRRLHERVLADPGCLRPANAAEQRRFDNERGSRGQRHERAGQSFDLSDVFGELAGALDEFSLLVWIPAILLFLLGVLMMAGAAPVLLTEGLAALLAEVAVQFLAGSLAARRLLHASRLDEAWKTVLARTWIAGLVFVAVAAAAGALLHAIDPELRSLGDLLRR